MHARASAQSLAAGFQSPTLSPVLPADLPSHKPSLQTSALSRVRAEQYQAFAKFNEDYISRSLKPTCARSSPVPPLLGSRPLLSACASRPTLCRVLAPTPLLLRTRLNARPWSRISASAHSSLCVSDAQGFGLRLMRCWIGTILACVVLLVHVAPPKRLDAALLIPRRSGNLYGRRGA